MYSKPSFFQRRVFEVQLAQAGQALDRRKPGPSTSVLPK